MIAFRNASLAELELVLEWAAAEGWNPGLDDAEAFFAADPRGFFVAVENDALVGAISVVNHSPAFAFLGLYIVTPPHRGKGIGFGLWKHAMQHAGDRTIGLDGVPEQQSNYAASGFQHAGKTVRYAGALDGATCPDMRPATTEDIGALIDREAKASGVRKAAYLAAWFSNASNRKTYIHPNGFLTVRQCREGAKIGPLIAEDKASASDMLRHVCAGSSGAIMIDVPVQSNVLATLCQSLSLSPVFETARMYRGAAPEADASVFAVASLELG